MNFPYRFGPIEPDSTTRRWPWQFCLEWGNPNRYADEWEETYQWCRNRFGSAYDPVRDNPSRKRHRRWMRTQHKYIFRCERAAMEFKLRWC
jgi:hypothetical protein